MTVDGSLEVAVGFFVFGRLKTVIMTVFVFFVLKSTTDVRNTHRATDRWEILMNQELCSGALMRGVK